MANNIQISIRMLRVISSFEGEADASSAATTKSQKTDKEQEIELLYPPKALNICGYLSLKLWSPQNCFWDSSF